jgi:catechol 2,3-dioxygenase-like lactoylglutathione lyase family enzyme
MMELNRIKMSEQKFPANAVCQVGFVVHDIERAAKLFSGLFGVDVPPIVETAGHAIAKTTVNGEPSEATAKLAFFNAGQLQFELIQPDDKPSVWREHLDKHGEGVHHIAFKVDNTGEAMGYLAEHGIEMKQQGLYTDGSGMYSYMDSAPVLGVMIELLESFKRG